VTQQGVRPLRGEVPAHQIRVAGRGGLAPGGAHPPAAAHALDPRGPHKVGDLVPADVVAGPAGGLQELVGSVDPVVRLPQRPKVGIITASRTARADAGRYLAA
jgi:hypothetical protein